jgi:hypothetical protein
MHQTSGDISSQFQQAHNQLLALRSHVPDTVTLQLVLEYNDLVDEIGKCKAVDLSRFRIAKTELSSATVLSYMDDFRAETHTNVSGPPQCDRDLFLRRIDGLLMYLETQNRLEKSEIGFR